MLFENYTEEERTSNSNNRDSLNKYFRRLIELGDQNVLQSEASNFQQ
jgi:hypothetical protein